MSSVKKLPEQFGFDGEERVSSGLTKGVGCPECGEKFSEHDKERVYPDDGPTGSWHWDYQCK